MDERNGFVLAVDLDGVCADHTRAFRDIVARRRGIDPAELPLERSWDFHEWDFSDGDFETYHRIAVLEEHMFREMDVIEDCAEVLWRLSDAGVWLRIVTHRLYVNWGHAVAAADTVAWLDRARIPYRDLCFLGAKAEVQADCYVDDAPHNVEALRAAGNEVIVFDQPYNRHVAGPRAHGWGEIEELVHDVAARSGTALERQLPGFDAGADRLDRRRGAEAPPERPEGASF